MKKEHKFIEIIAILGIMAFGFIACDTGTSPSINGHTHSWSWAASVWGMETGTCSGCTETRLRLTANMMEDIPAGSMPLALSGGYTPYLTAFKIGKYQVTQAQYEAVMESNPSYFTTGADIGEEQEKRPVEQVSWYDAVEFCNALSVLEGLSPAYTIDKLNQDTNNNNAYDTIKWTVTLNSGSDGYRLPTEAQWEYACRAGTTGKWFHGSVESGLENYAWYVVNSNKTHEVGKKTANTFGLHDMHGNVWEWCWDWNGSYPGGTPTDPPGAVSGSIRVIRGGSWTNSSAGTASSNRDGNGLPYIRDYSLGFRLVRP